MHYELIDDPRAFLALVQRLEAAPAFAFAVDSAASTTTSDPSTERITSLGFATAEDSCALVPMSRRALRDGLHPSLVKARLRAFFAAREKSKITHGLKAALHLFAHEGVPIAPPFLDVKVARDLLDAAYGELFPDAARRALESFRQARHLAPLIASEGLAKSLHEVEMPLVPVLSDMERAGIFADGWVLDELANVGSKAALSTALIHPESGRIHPVYEQATGPSGRLRCTLPDLRKLRARSDHGRELRRSFRAMRGGDVLIAADLAQLELRILAHLADERDLSQALARGADAHVQTASTIFGVAPHRVTATMRDRAKRAVGGLVHGTRSRATARLMERFRAACPAIDAYYAGGSGPTLLGRAGPPAIAASAAEAVKLALLKTHRALRDGGFATHLVMQVDDELVFEAPAAELEDVQAVIRRAMESAFESVAPLPLVVDLGFGANWLEAHFR